MYRGLTPFKRHLYEMIREHSPCHAYLDVEFQFADFELRLSVKCKLGPFPLLFPTPPHWLLPHIFSPKYRTATVQQDITMNLIALFVEALRRVVSIELSVE